jgi:D-amino-acid dehydrogenase
MDLLDRDTTIDRRRIEALLSAARPYVADWPTDVASADAVDEPWAGLRPMTADGLPIIDRLPTATNCYVATGHAMMGISLGLSTGLALAEFITEGKRPERLAPFALGH